MNRTQFHFADTFGKFAMISLDFIIISKKHQTSTNFKCCGTDDAAGTCWGFLIAEKQIADNGVNMKT